MKICIAGKNNIAVKAVDYLINNLNFDKKNLFIITNQTDLGEDSWQRSLLKFAKTNNLSIVTLEDIYSYKDILFLSLEFDRIINPNLFSSCFLYNIHFSLLPKYKGMFTSIIPILNNESFSGVTLHKIDFGIDTGDIIAQKKFPINKHDTSRDLYLKYTNLGIELIKEYLPRLLKNEILHTSPQKVINSSYYSKQSLNFNDLVIDLNQTALNIHNQVRAYNFREYQQPIIFGAKIISSKVSSIRSKQKPGKIIFENEISFLISTIDYNLILYKDRSSELFTACESGDLLQVQTLVQIPKIINVQNNKGWTPLIVAIYHNQIEIVKILLLNGADIRITNFKGTTCLMYAKSSYEKYRNTTLLELFLNLSDNILQEDYSKKNIIDYCLANEELSSLKIIQGNQI